MSSHPISIFIVDDEIDARELLKLYFAKARIAYKVVGEASSVAEALNKLNQLDFDLLLLDIHLQDGTGFELLDHFPNPNFDIIFITSYDEFALKAFQYAAVNYLLKPILYEDFLAAIEKYANDTQRIQMSYLIDSLQQLKQGQQFKRLALSTFEGLVMIDLSNIIRLEADKAYTTFYMKDGEQHIVAKNLGMYENLLPPHYFFRIHFSHIINLNYVKIYLKQDGGQVILSNGKKLPIARRRKEEFLYMLKKISLT